MIASTLCSTLLGSAFHARQTLIWPRIWPARDKDYRMELARDKIPNKSILVLMDQRQPEVQFCNDHATGLCKVSHTHFINKYFHWWTCCDHNIFCQVCDSARINFESYRRAVKAACQCPAWACWCLVRFPNWLISQTDLVSWVYNTLKTVKSLFGSFQSFHLVTHCG